MSDINATQMGANFDSALVTDLFNKVQGYSTIAKLSAQKAIPFTGEKEFTFSMNDGVQIVGESGQKKDNSITVEPVVITPKKFVYQARFTNEFLTASAEQKLDYLKAFNDGAAKEYAKAIDLAAMHGINPYTGEASTFIGTNSIDGLVDNVTPYDAETVDEDLDTLINGLNCDVTGIAFSKTAAAAMGKIKVQGIAQYPEFRFGGKPAEFAGINSDVNTTVSAAPAETAYNDQVIVGDFQNAFKWGYAAQMPLEVIQYGDPDGTGRDLKAYNEVCLRLEAYIGFGILDPTRFAIIRDESVDDSDVDDGDVVDGE